MTRSQIIKQQRLYLSFLPHVRKQFGSLPGVRLIGLGAKEKQGRLLEEWAFRFYVEKKRPSEEIPDHEQIPARIFGVQTDVIAHFAKESLVCDVAHLAINNDEYRDQGIRGGISIRNEHFENDHPSGYGTLGILTRRKSDNALVGLTCAHVANAASENNTAINTKIGQPKYWISCCCCPRGHIGDVSKATFNDDLDCALIEIHDDIRDKVTANNTENKIEGIGADISGAAAIVCFDNLQKYGRATGLTNGKVSDVAFGTNQMLIERTGGNPGDPFACYGDSGSVIVNSGNQVVGLLVAARRENMAMAIATHIKPVMTDLGITIAGTDAATIGEPIGGGATGCELHAWPGGNTNTSLNPLEEFNSTDFGFAGNVDWDVSGGAAGAVIVESGGQTANGLSRITVRYDTVSASKNPTDAVWVKAISGSDEVTKFRTVFKFTPRAVNISDALDSDNTKRFAATGGSDNQAGAAVPGTDGATWFLAKAEIVFDILPQGIQWSNSGGIDFVTGSPAGLEGNIIARRETKFTRGEQADGAANRTHTDEEDWVSAGDSAADDFQEPTDAAPNKLFRLANEGFDPANLLQGYLRADFRDYLEFNHGTAWVRITPFAEWFANLTADLSGTGSPPPTVGAPNALGTGANAENIPNQPPVITVNNFQEVKPGERVTLSATPTDPDNDTVTVNWAQTAGPAVALSSPTGDSVTFNAPANDPQLKFTATGDDGTGTLSRTAGNHLSAPEEITVNVIEWKNIGGGDPVVDRNMTEDFNAADFGIGAGPLNWDVTTGGTNAVIIEADGVAVVPTGTHNGATTIKVRYDNRSGDLTRAQTVRIQATHPGNGKVWFKRRTVFRVTVAVHATDNHTHRIPSTLAPRGQDHFCTAQGQGNTILDATIAPVPADMAGVTWHGTGVFAFTVPAIGADRTTARISSNTGTGQDIPISIQISGDVCYRGRFWTIWSTVAQVITPATPVTFNVLHPNGSPANSFSREITHTYTIQPATIVTATPAVDDIPDLRGTNRSLAGVVVDPPDVPAGDANVANSGAGVLAGGADRKWDVSRQIRRRAVNVANIPTTVAANAFFYTSFLNYPSDQLAGNDDRGTADEDNDPYTAGTAGIGNIDSLDTPSRPIIHTDGAIGDTFEVRNHFREFARVLLDDTWYPISGFDLWKLHFLGVKRSEAADGADYDGDGAQNKTFWIDNGTTIALDNAGF